MNARGGRKRVVDPGLWLNEDLGRCTVHARFLFPRLVTLADFRGVFRWRPGPLLRLAFPFDADVVVDRDTGLLSGMEPRPSIVGMLDELTRPSEEPENPPVLVRFDVDGRTYGWITGFELHQSPYIKEVQAGSDLPDPIALGIGLDASWGDDLHRRVNAKRRTRKGYTAHERTDAVPRGTNGADGGKRDAFPREIKNHRPDRDRAVPGMRPVTPVTSDPVTGNADPDRQCPCPVPDRSVTGPRSGSADAYLDELARRAHEASFDPETGSWRAYWRETVRRLHAAGLMGVLEDALETVAMAADKDQRKAKGIGLLHSPGKFLTAKCDQALKHAGSSAPGPPSAVDAGEFSELHGPPDAAESQNWQTIVRALSDEMGVN